MTVTYQRDVAHCEPSTYIKEVTIKSVEPAVNSDRLEIIKFEEIGWQVISQKGLHTPNKKVYYIPPESVLPFEFSEEIGVTTYLAKGRVKVARLRGNNSEGIIVDKEKVEQYIPYILQWETKPTVGMRGDSMKHKDTPLMFRKFYKMPNLLNEPETFMPGESIARSEKIHGTNCRFGRHPHPETEEPQLYVGSHNMVLKETEGNLYWQQVRIVVKDENELPLGYTFYGEIYGVGIQDLTYNTAPTIKVFAITDESGEYLVSSEVERLCSELDLPMVKFNKCTFVDVETAKLWADTDSEYDSEFKEGEVLVSRENPELMAKVLSFKYLARKGERTERH